MSQADFWKGRAKRLLKSELTKRDLSQPELVRLLNRIDADETVASVRNKISRGSFSAAFLLKCMHAMGSDELALNLPDRSANGNLRKTNANGRSFEQATSLFDSSERVSERVRSQGFYHDQIQNLRYVDIREVSKCSLQQNKVISLFTGAGGLDIGLERAGFETAVCVETDADCRETIRENTEWPVFEDTDNGDREAGNIREIEATELVDYGDLEKGEPALVVGGAPCQPFSNIGKRKGADDPENGDLFQEFVRIVEGVEPKAFVFENVAGITQSRHDEVIEYMTEQFEGLGYSIAWSTLNAADYGVPQKRKRFFLIGILGEEEPAFPLPTHYENKEKWRDLVSNLDGEPNYIPDGWNTVADAFERIPDDAEDRSDYKRMHHGDRIIKRMEFVGPGENFKVVPDEHLPNCWKNGKHQGQDTFGRMEWDKPSNTIRTAGYNPTKGRYIHPEENRGIDTYEMKVLQGFDPDWQFKRVEKDKITLKSAGNQIGNAVPPPLAEAIGKALAIQLDARTA